MVSRSYGSRVRKSMTSHETPSLSSHIVATSRNTCTCVPYPTSVTSVPARTQDHN